MSLNVEPAVINPPSNVGATSFALEPLGLAPPIERSQSRFPAESMRTSHISWPPTLRLVLLPPGPDCDHPERMKPPPATLLPANKASESVPPKVRSQILSPSPSTISTHASLPPNEGLVLLPPAGELAYPLSTNAPPGKTSIRARPS